MDLPAPLGRSISRFLDFSTGAPIESTQTPDLSAPLGRSLSRFLDFSTEAPIESTQTLNRQRVCSPRPVRFLDSSISRLGLPTDPRFVCFPGPFDFSISRFLDIEKSKNRVENSAVLDVDSGTSLAIYPISNTNFDQNSHLADHPKMFFNSFLVVSPGKDAPRLDLRTRFAGKLHGKNR